jgi:hypothetical protein
MKAPKSFLAPLLLALGLFLSLQLPSLRDLYKFVPEGSHMLSHVFLAAAFFIYLRFAVGCKRDLPSFKRALHLLESKYVFMFLSFSLVLVSVVLYPVVDELKHIGMGSDQDDSLISAADALMRGINPYTTVIPVFENPRSPGPGWIMVALPFVLLKAYPLFSPVAIIAASILLFRTTGRWAVPNLFVVLSFSSLIMWDLLVEGSDLVPLGFILLALLILIYGSRAIIENTVLLSMLTGMVATARISFFYIPVLFAVILSSRDRKAALLFAAVGTLTMLSLHLAFYYWSSLAGQFYQPLHLLGLQARFLPGGFGAAALLACALAGVAIFIMRKADLGSWLLCSWLGVYAPLFFLGLGDLFFARSLSLTVWEGANYLVPPIPLFVAYVSLRLRT